jgi:hypothetical protein
MNKKTSLIVKKKQEIESAKAWIREGVRRYGLPFGMAGKERSFLRGVQSKILAQVKVLIIQDSLISSPPELIFGIEPGDCACVQTSLNYASQASTASMELLINQHPAALIVIATSSKMPNSVRVVHRTIRQLERESEYLRNKMAHGNVDIEGCIVDEERRQVQFI